MPYRGDFPLMTSLIVESIKNDMKLVLISETVTWKSDIAYIYMYTTDSVFNTVSINNYMSDGIPIIPVPEDLMGSNSSSLNKS